MVVFVLKSLFRRDMNNEKTFPVCLEQKTFKIFLKNKIDNGSKLESDFV